MSALVFLAATLAAVSDRADLTGRVLDVSGKPVRGARVSIHTAGARVGVNPFCPSCYADCAKSADTGDDGGFLIRSLDSSLIFRVLIVGEGFEPSFVGKVDPFKGPIEATLRPIDLKRLEPRRFIRGRVVDPEGSPVAGAEVTPIEFKTEAHWGFAPDIVDPVAVTNLRGEFVLTSRSPAEYISVKIIARGLAPRRFDKLSPEVPIHELRLGRGVSVTGHVSREGKSLPGTVVGLVQVSRRSDTFLGATEISTDESGRFLFSNVAPNDRYYVYGIMSSLKVSGSLPAVELKAGGDGTTTDVGELEVVPGHRLAGRIVLSDGKPIPPHTRILVSREQAWDSQLAELDERGRFVVEGLPTEEYSVSSFIKGYRLSAKNECASPHNPGLLEGRVDRDVSDLTILYEPSGGEERGAANRNDSGSREAMKLFDDRRKRLIGGVAPATDH